MRDVNWENYTSIAYGVLGWTPDIFWRSTPLDFHLSFKAWKKVNNISEGDGALRRDDLNRLISSLELQEK